MSCRLRTNSRILFAAMLTPAVDRTPFHFDGLKGAWPRTGSVFAQCRAASPKREQMAAKAPIRQAACHGSVLTVRCLQTSGPLRWGRLRRLGRECILEQQQLPVRRQWSSTQALGRSDPDDQVVVSTDSRMANAAKPLGGRKGSTWALTRRKLNRTKPHGCYVVHHLYNAPSRAIAAHASLLRQRWAARCRQRGVFASYVACLLM